MSNIPQEPAANTPGRSNGNIRETAVEGTESQPRLGRQLQGSAQKIANDIGMTHNNFEFVLGGSFFRNFRLSIKVFREGLFDAWVILICHLNDLVGGGSSGRDVMTRTTFIQIGIGFEVRYALNVFGNNIGRFFGACHIGDAQR